MSKTHVLITGAQGFIGRALVKRLSLEKTFTIYEFDQQHGDISDSLPTYEKIDHIFHLAARTFVPESWKNPKDFFRTNIFGTLNILELCRKYHANLTFLSAYLYGRPQSLPISETHPLSPLNPYSQSKKMAEDLCTFYAQQFQISTTILRPFNVFGPSQREDFLIPTILKQALNPSCTSIEVTDLKPKRDFVYIDDLLEAMLATFERRGHSIFNIGSGRSYSVEELIQIILRCTGKDMAYRSTQQSRPDEIFDLYADISAARSQLNWKPKVDLEDGIRKILKEYL